MSAHYFALIADGAGQRLWLQPAGAGWTLPRLTIAERFWWQEVAPVNRAAREQLGCEVSTLRCAGISGDETSGRLYYALEPAAKQRPAAGRWLEAGALASPLEQRMITEWLHASIANREAVPWYHPGWRKGALTWAREQLAGLGLSPAAGPEQVRSWERSALWRWRTSGGAVYFKAAPEMFAHEPRLSQALGERHPRWCPPVLAGDEHRRWMLVGDVGPQTGNTRKDASMWQAGLRAYAEMQIALSDCVPALLALGVPDRRLSLLPAQIEAVLADTAALKNSPAGLSDEEISALRRRLPEVHAACQALAASPIPATLEHGDFSPGQMVFADDGGCRFIDWSDSAIAFPFFSAQFFWEELEGEVANAAEARLGLRAAYLEPWTVYAPMEALIEWFALAMRVAPFYYATIYHRAILPRMAFPWEMERMLPYYLRMALRGSS